MTLKIIGLERREKKHLNTKEIRYYEEYASSNTHGETNECEKSFKCLSQFKRRRMKI